MIWLPVVVVGYGVVLGLALAFAYNWRKSSREWEEDATRWRRQYARQAGIAEALRGVCRGIGFDITVLEKPDGVDIFVTHPPEEGQETRH